jgi:hypothetical protein
VYKHYKLRIRKTKYHRWQNWKRLETSRCFESAVDEEVFRVWAQLSTYISWTALYSHFHIHFMVAYRKDVEWLIALRVATLYWYFYAHGLNQTLPHSRLKGPHRIAKHSDSLKKSQWSEACSHIPHIAQGNPSKKTGNTWRKSGTRASKHGRVTNVTFTSQCDVNKTPSLSQCFIICNINFIK